MPIGKRFANDGLSDEATQQGNRIVASEKDPLGQKLHDVKGARVDQWARQHDAELLLTNLLKCPEGHGAWIDGATLDSITKS